MIRTIESKERVDVVQVGSNQVIVKRENGTLRVQCDVVSEIGSVPCNLTNEWNEHYGHGCWHIVSAVRTLTEQRGFVFSWWDTEDEAQWNWGTRLDNRKWAVREYNSNQLLGFIVAHRKEQAACLSN